MGTYKNTEGYSDPTAGEAIGHVAVIERRKHKKRPVRRLVKKIYVASRYAGDVDANVKTAIKCCRYVIEQGCMPVASHLLYPQILDDNNPKERKLGLRFAVELLIDCDEVWVFMQNGEISPGMEQEMIVAKRLEKPVRKIEMGC